MRRELARIFLPPENFDKQENTAVGGQDEAHYLCHVLRYQEEDNVVLLDGQGNAWSARIHRFADQEVFFVLEDRLPCEKESPLETTLVQALCKKDNFEWVLQKATELGVKRIIPLESERTEAAFINLPQKKQAKKMARWQKIIKNAAQQCKRAVIPEIDTPSSFHAFIQAIQNQEHANVWQVVCHETANQTVGEIINTDNRQLLPVMILIGPEGGFTETELRLASAAGFKDMRLGPRILRTETAGVVALTLMQYELGDLGGR